MIKVDVFSVSDTEAVGYRLIKLMKRRGIILLDGDLGVGKTVFVTGVAKALNIHEYIKSPTFTIVNEYIGDKELSHFDVYRICEDDLEDIGFWDYIRPEVVVVIEWASRIYRALPRDVVKVNIEKDLDKGLDYRSITIEFCGIYKELEHEIAKKEKIL